MSAAYVNRNISFDMTDSLFSGDKMKPLKQVIEKNTDCSSEGLNNLSWSTQFEYKLTLPSDMVPIKCSQYKILKAANRKVKQQIQQWLDHSLIKTLFCHGLFWFHEWKKRSCCLMKKEDENLYKPLSIEYSLINQLLSSTLNNRCF